MSLRGVAGKLFPPTVPGDIRKRKDISQLQLQCREPASRCQPSHTPCCHTHLNCQQLWLLHVTQCPLRLDNTSSPDLIFPEIWLMLVLPPKKGCQGRTEIENMISLVTNRMEPNTAMQQEGRKVQPAWFPVFVVKGSRNYNMDFDWLALYPPPFVYNVKITLGAAGREKPSDALGFSTATSCLHCRYTYCQLDIRISVMWASPSHCLNRTTVCTLILAGKENDQH